MVQATLFESSPLLRWCSTGVPPGATFLQASSSVGRHPLVSCILYCARYLRPVCCKLLESASEKFTHSKSGSSTSFNFTKSRTSTVSSLFCLDFAPGMVKYILHPRPDYILKVPFMASQPVILQVFFPPPHASLEQEMLHLLCPALACSI